jgi:hypothetical protein
MVSDASCGIPADNRAMKQSPEAADDLSLAFPAKSASKSAAKVRRGGG